MSRDSRFRIHVLNTPRNGRFMVPVPAETRDIFFFTSSTPIMGSTQPPAQWAQDFSLSGKQWGREFDHSPPYSADVKNEYRYTSAPLPKLPPCIPSKYGQELHRQYTFIFMVKYILKMKAARSSVT